MRRAALSLFVLCLVAVSPALAVSTDRQDTGVVQDETQMQYHAVINYTGQDAANVRRPYDQPPANNKINATEGALFVANASSSRLNNQTSNLRWDGNPTYWVDITASAPGFVSNSMNANFSLVLDGTVNLTSLSGYNHTLTISNLTSYNNGYTLSLTLPSNWTIVGVSGINVSFQSQNSLAGSISPTDIGVIQVQKLPPAPPNDTEPPVVNAGADRTVDAGAACDLNGTAADNDPAFLVTATYWWTFTYNGTVQNFSGKNMSFTFWVLGVYTLTLSAIDRAGNVGESSLQVTVQSPDTAPPVVGVGPDANISAGASFSRTASAADNDPTFDLLGRFWWSFSYNGTPENLSGKTLSFTFWRLGVTALTFSAMDPWGNIASGTLQLTVVSPDTTPPVVNAGQNRSAPAGAPTTLAANVTDNDPTILQNGTFWWTFLYNGTERNLSGVRVNFTFWVLGTYTVVFTAVDPWGNRKDDVLQLTIVSPDTTPPLVDAGPDVDVNAGDTVTLAGSATDTDPGFAVNARYWWNFSYGDANVTKDGLQVSFRFDVEGTYNATLFARDGWGNIGHDSRIVVVKPLPANNSGQNGTPAAIPPVATSGGADLLLPGVLLGVGIFSLAGLAVYRRRTASLAEPAQEPPAPPPEAAAAARLGPTCVIEGLLILYKDGRLIHHQAAGTESMFESPEVVGSMFTAVTEFIRDSFREEGALSRLTYGQNTIILERSAHLFGAAIVFGEPDEHLRGEMRETMRRLESAYAGVIERWDGDRARFQGIEGFVAPLLGLTAGVTRAQVQAASRDQTVKLLSGTEHYKGYLRLRVALVNQTDSKITDAAVTAVFNQNVLRLARVEPPQLKQEGFTVHLGEVAPGERVGAIYYLDPQTCSQTNIEAIATYRDASGESREVKMKPRIAEIVCPLFFTPHHANPATMKRLVETSLAARDSKLYRLLSFPPGTGYREVFDVARDAVARHHVVLIRNISTKAPFEGKAWFYGQTKNTKSPVIIRATASEERHAVEFFVAVDSPATLTGLLAEFHRSFLKMMQDRLPGVRLEPVLDDALKGLMAAEEFDASPTEGGRA